MLPHLVETTCFQTVIWERCFSCSIESDDILGAAITATLVAALVAALVVATAFVAAACVAACVTSKDTIEY